MDQSQDQAHNLKKGEQGKMTPKQMFYKLIEKDGYDIYIWFQFFLNKIDCRDCIQTRKRGSGVPPECNKCIPASSLIQKTFGKKENKNV